MSLLNVRQCDLCDRQFEYVPTSYRPVPLFTPDDSGIDANGKRTYVNFVDKDICPRCLTVLRDAVILISARVRECDANLKVSIQPKCETATKRKAKSR